MQRLRCGPPRSHREIVSNVASGGQTVREVMSPVRAIAGPRHTLAQAARRMIAHDTGAAVVLDPDRPGPAIISERDLLRAVASGLDPDRERVEDHMTEVVATAGPEWPLADAARLMVTHGVRHILVFEEGWLTGVVAMRDLLGAGALTPASLLAASAR